MPADGQHVEEAVVEINRLYPKDEGESPMRRMVIVTVAVLSGVAGFDVADQSGTLGAGAKHTFAAEPGGAGNAERKAEPARLTRVTLQDFENASSKPTVWVVNIPNENASVQLSTDHPHEGQQCLKLHYHFTRGGQYMGMRVYQEKE